MDHSDSWLGLDIGGANVKAAHSSGAAATAPFAVWKDPAGLAGALRRVARGVPWFDGVAVTMTAELCDCFATKSEGVQRVLDSVLTAFPERSVVVWTMHGRFAEASEVLEDPRIAAATNWHALATSLCRTISEPTLLIDVGSTTTDIVALEPGRVLSASRTDGDRLTSGELVYAGVKRTPLCALATDVRLPSAGSIGLCAELFATTRDVYQMLGRQVEDPLDCETADGRPAVREFARARLARMLSADPEDFSEARAIELAAAFDEILCERLVHACLRLLGERRFAAAIVCGSGEFLAGRAAERVLSPPASVTRLSAVWGEAASASACARAVMLLACGGEGPSLERRKTRAAAADRLVVLKLGGSLLAMPGLAARLERELERWKTCRRLLVVGGGKAADAIRELDRVHALGDERAHWLAIEAMDLNARVVSAMMSGLRSISDRDTLESAWLEGSTPIAVAGRLVKAIEPTARIALRRDWSVTSDSIAAWLAAELGAERLVFLKSAPGPRDGSVHSAAASGLIDRALPEWLPGSVAVEFVNLASTA